MGRAESDLKKDSDTHGVPKKKFPFKEGISSLCNSIKLTTSTQNMVKFHSQRFEFVLLQMWFIILAFLVCFGSNQCPLITSQCNAISALNTSFNLPTSITNYGNNQTNPCSKGNKTRKELLTASSVSFFFDRLARSKLQFFIKSNNSNLLDLIESHRINSNWNWIDDFIAIAVRRK